MTIWTLLRKCSLGGVVLLLMFSMAFVASPMQDRMAGAMTQMSHHMSMTPQPMSAPEAMSKGPLHTACEILCLGVMISEPLSLPVVQARLLQLHFAPSPAPSVANRSPAPAQRPPQSDLLA